MKNKIIYPTVLLSSLFFIQNCGSIIVPAPPPPPVQVMNKPAAVSQAKQEFRNFRRAMVYLDESGNQLDNKNGYFDINVQTLRTLYEEAANKGWSNVRVYHGMDNAGNRTLLVNGLNVNGATLEETAKVDSDIVVKIDNPSIKPGSDCPRWCDTTTTTLGK